jgi:Ca2+-binding RTX toxin-like protein
MKRYVFLLASLVAAQLLATGVALALPSELPDPTPMVNGPVRTFAQVGDNVWVGGNFSRVEQRDGTLVDDVANVAVFSSTTGGYVDVAPALSGNVRDIAVYGANVVIGGSFAGPSGTKKNLVVVDGTTGSVVRWYNAPALQSVLAAPRLGRVYGGGVSLSAFDFEGGQRLWSRASTTVDQDLRSHYLAPGYRDLELDADGLTIWAACACDAVVAPDGTSNPAKALVKLDVEGNHDASWLAEAGVGAYGISVVDHEGSLYLGAGGSDYLARHSKATAKREWLRDTSGSTQVVEVMDGGLVVGGHFWEVAGQSGVNCGFRSPDPTTLDPSPGGVCETRHGLAAYSFSGALDPDWDPGLAGKYNLAWALLPEVTTEGPRLYVGGEFLTVSGTKQTNYARLSNAQAPPPPSPCTLTGTSVADTLTGTPADDVICAGGGNDTLNGLEGNDILRGEAGADKLFGGAGDDTLDGGSGTDTANYSGSPAALTASLADSSATGEGSDVLAGVENLIGSNANDTLTGSDANNVLSGGGGADRIVGLTGADKLVGATGDDNLDSRDGVAGNDSLDGGAGTDTCSTDVTEQSVLRCER